MAKPLGCCGTGTDDLQKSKPKIAKKAPKNASVLTLAPIDHKLFVSVNKSKLATAKQEINDSRSTGGNEIPHTRSAAYLEHNLKVLDKFKPGNKLAISRSKSLNNVVYHRVNEGKLDRIKNLLPFSSKK